MTFELPGSLGKSMCNEEYCVRKMTLKFVDIIQDHRINEE